MEYVHINRVSIYGDPCGISVKIYEWPTNGRYEICLLATMDWDTNLRFSEEITKKEFNENINLVLQLMMGAMMPDLDYSICPKCRSQMEVDEEYYATDQSYWNGLVAEKDLVYWCNSCEQVYIGGEKA